MSSATTNSQSPLSKTPHLDRQVPLPRRNVGLARIKWWQAGLFLLGLSLELFRVLFAIWMLQILIHELGHLVGGLLVGQRFNSIRVGILEIDHPGKLSWQWRRGAVLSGGTSTLPVAKSGLRWKLLLSTAAGPAATLLSGFLVLRLMPQRESFLAGVCQLFVAVSFFLGITNLLPIQHRGQMLDGMTLWILVFDKARRERLISMLDLVADVKQGKQIKSLKEYSLDRWASANDGTAAHVVANWAGYTDAKDSEVAGQHLEVCLASSSAISPEFRSLLILEAAKYQALRRNRVNLANAWLADDGEGKPEFGRYWAEAVILQHEGKWDDAIAKVEDALKYVKGLPESRAHTSQQQALTELRASLREQLGGSDPNVRS